MMDNKSGIAILLAGSFGILMFIFYPLVLIWAVNTLFTLNLEYTFINWVCVILLSAGVAKLKK